MATLKRILFSRLAGDGLTQLIRETQRMYTPKKGRRFNHENITYEISRPGMVKDNIEFEISSKIPQDELKGDKKMSGYFNKIKQVLSKTKNKPVSIEMENIVWDSKKDTEKERDYVKLLYSYPLNDLYNNKEVMARFEKITANEDSESLPAHLGALTPQGKIVLQMVKETILSFARENIEQLINANKQVRADMKS
ncbi:MAG: hypothetical protein QF732_05470 [Nitrospinaceae bacterium]|jgi:hypothetical protein|nr:hypothetical protein [Nitrospinaceae bacterium]|tara:strand:- start:250 stop:834 length:585 start_codon:yes stop_codon:yes gene_type:complete